MKNTGLLNEMAVNEASLHRFHTQQREGDSRRARMMELLRHAMALELTERQQRCITLYYFEEKPVREIARLLGIRPTTVYKHLKIARNHLKRLAVYL